MSEHDALVAELEKRARDIYEQHRRSDGTGHPDMIDAARFQTAATTIAALSRQLEAGDALRVAVRHAASLLRSIAGGHGYGEAMSPEARGFIQSIAAALTKPDLSRANLEGEE